MSSSSVLGAVGLWWLASALATIASKRLIEWDAGLTGGKGEEYAEEDSSYNGVYEDKASPFLTNNMGWVELTLLQQVAGILLAVTWGRISGEVVCAVDIFRGEFQSIFIIVIGNMANGLATNAGFMGEASNVALAILACQPLFTFLLSSIVSTSENAPHRISKLSLMVIVLGAVLFVFGEPNFDSWSVGIAVISIAALPIRNVFMKRLSSDCGSTPLQNFTIMSTYSVMFLIPVYLVKRVMVGGSKVTAYNEGAIISSFFYAISGISSVTILDKVIPVTHAVLGLGEKLFYSLASIIRFDVPFSANMSIGLLICFIGFYLYQQKSSHWILAKKCSLLLVLLYFALIMVLRTNQPVQFSPRKRSTCFMENRISTAWIYDRPIPSAVVHNLAVLATLNPGMAIHIYCGTSQCLHAVSNIYRVHSEIAVVSEILSDTPLEQWGMDHAHNKLLAGEQYESHLNEAIRLGILWKHGGYYIDPALNLTAALPPPLCWSSAGARMLAGTRQMKERITDSFDAVYFPKTHPLIGNLMEQFAEAYPTGAVTEGEPFEFSYKERVWDIFNGRSSCTSCPDLIASLELKYISTNSLKSRKKYYGAQPISMPKEDHGKSAGFGDELQVFIAGLQFLPFLDHMVNMDTVDTEAQPFSSTDDPNVTVFFNSRWEQPQAGASPPFKHLDPIMVGVHAQKDDMTKAWVDYLKQKEPIGCRDSATLNLMQLHRVSAFLSGPVTLLLKMPNTGEARDGKIYLVDVKDEYFKLLPESVREGEVVVQVRKNSDEGFDKEYTLMKKLAVAKLVITEDINSALSCAALGTPVIYIDSAKLPSQGSSTALEMTELFHTVRIQGNNSSTTQGVIRNWFQSFPYHQPPPNPNLALLMRLRASAWNVVRRHGALRDAGKKFGVVPFLIPDPAPENSTILFHLIYTTSNLTVVGKLPNGEERYGGFNWRHWRSVESIFYHHPTAKVIVHSNTLPVNTFDVLVESGYSIRVEKYDLEEMLIRSPSDNFLEGIEAARTKDPTYVHEAEADLLRLLVMYESGGIYMDADTILVRPIETLPANALVWTSGSNSTLSTKFMKFERDNEFVCSCLRAFSKQYSSLGADWMNSHGLNSLLTSKWNEWQGDNFGNTVVLSHHSFYNIIPTTDVIQKCFSDKKGLKFESDRSITTRLAYGVSLNSDLSGHMGVEVNVEGRKEVGKVNPGTLCGHLLNSFCVLCSNMHL